MAVRKSEPFPDRSKSIRYSGNGPDSAHAARNLPAPRAGRLGPLAERNFRVFYLGYATSLLGSAMSPIAINFALLDHGVTAAGLGIVLAAGVVPQVLLMIGAGVIADRLGRRSVMLTADVGRMAVMATVAALLFTATPAVWVYAVLAALRGIGDALFTPALGGLRSEISATERLPDANALLQVAESAAKVAGPALAGVLIVAIRSSAVVALDAETYGISVIALVLLRVPAGSRPASTVWHDLVDGWSEFRAHTWLWLTTAQWSLLNLLTYAPYLLLGPIMAQDYLGGARIWGFVIGAQAAGAVLTGLLLVGRRPSRPLVVSALGTVAVPVPCLLLAVHASAVPDHRAHRDRFVRARIGRARPCGPGSGGGRRPARAGFRGGLGPYQRHRCVLPAADLGGARQQRRGGTNAAHRRAAN